MPLERSLTVNRGSSMKKGTAEARALRLVCRQHPEVSGSPKVLTLVGLGFRCFSDSLRGCELSFSRGAPFEGRCGSFNLNHSKKT